MNTAPIAENEANRLEALQEYHILDTPEDEAFESLARLAAQICKTPVAAISFVDATRQWCKACIGWEHREIARETSICSYAILQEDLFEVEDLAADARFSGNPLLQKKPALRFYAGMPLTNTHGFRLGTLCVLDYQSRRLTREEASALRSLARQVTAQLELRRFRAESDDRLERFRLTEVALRQSESFYLTLVETLPQHIFRKDAQGHFTFANFRFCEALGRPVSQVLGKTDFDFFPPELAQKYLRDDLRVMSSRHSLETTEAHQNASGEKLFVHVIKTPLFDSEGQVCGIQGIFWDVTQRKKIEEALAYERDLLRALLDNIPDRIYFKDVNSKFFRCSLSMARRLGLADPMQIVGKTDFDFHDPKLAQEFYTDEQRIILTGQPLINKLERQLDLQGNEIWASVTKVPIYNKDGHVRGIIGISRDVTQLKQAESALEQARDAALETARVKAEFLANMSHEIRTPMNAIVGMTGLLVDTQLNQEQHEFVETIRDSTFTLLSLVNDVLDFSRIEAGKLTLEAIDFNLRDAIECTVEMLAEIAQRKGIELICQVEPTLPGLLRGDPNRFRQILANLLSNAVKFTERGEVQVRVSKAGEEEGKIIVRCEVQDTGVGIGPAVQESIFEAFTQADGSTTRKYGGSGLGLTICKQLVDLMHGQIGVQSAPGKGSIFWFTLPLEKTAESSQDDLQDVEHLTGRSVLVLEHNTTQRHALAQLLRSWGMVVEEAGRGGDALAMLLARARDGSPFHIALIDTEVTDTDGVALTRAIRVDPRLEFTRLVVVSSLAQRMPPELMQEIGVAGRLVKPVRQLRLLDCLVDALGDSGATASAGERLPAHPLLGSATRRSQGARILLAEDNPVNQRLTLHQLKKLGFRAQAVRNGREALTALQREPYDILLLDCQMPEMDGFELTRQIRGRPSEVHETLPYIIALTARALHGDRERCLTAGMNDYLTKPVHLPDLETALTRALQKVQGKIRRDGNNQSLDMAILSGLRELREPNQPDPVRELIELFLKDSRPRINQMTHALSEHDFAGLSTCAHALKGSASNLGARRLAELCARLENEAKSANLTDSAKILLELKGEFAEVEKLLLAEMGK